MDISYNRTVRCNSCHAVVNIKGRMLAQAKLDSVPSKQCYPPWTLFLKFSTANREVHLSIWSYKALSYISINAGPFSLEASALATLSFVSWTRFHGDVCCLFLSVGHTYMGPKRQMPNQEIARAQTGLLSYTFVVRRPKSRLHSQWQWRLVGSLTATLDNLPTSPMSHCGIVFSYLGITETCTNWGS